MGVAVELLDAVVVKLDESSFGTAVVERQILPDVSKKDLSAKIIVALQGKESHELDRTRESILYTVAVGLHAPVDARADHETYLDLVEEIQDWLSQRVNRNLTLTGGEAKLLLPFSMEAPFDAALIRESGIYFAVTNFVYRYTKNRS